MKKLFIMFVAIATIGLMGCNQPNQEPTENVDSTYVDTTQVDTSGTVVADTPVQ